MDSLEKQVLNDLLLVQDAFGSDFIYEEHNGELIAISFDDEGDEVARYTVKVSLQKQ